MAERDDNHDITQGDVPALYSGNDPIGSFVEAVCVRPVMYTMDGTWAEVGAFLEGFYSGMGGHSSTKAGREGVERWMDFCHWALLRLTGRGHSEPYQLFQTLREKYPEEAVAFVRLAELCIEYRQSGRSL
ncbi:MAG: hypothetical protein V4671_24625 [Armatimonadota bacterium]